MKSIRIGVQAYSLLSLLILINPVLAQVQQTVTEPEIIVSGTRSEQSGVVIPASISVITREDIEASGAKHIAEVLRAKGAIQLSDLYGDGTRSSISMRGLSAASNTLILVDGRRLNNPDIGEPDLNSVSIKAIERIEIIQGSASVLFGNQAVGGVINIISKSPDKFATNAEVITGSFDRQGLRIGIANAWNNGLSFELNGESRESDNYREHNDIEYDNVFAKTGFDYEHGQVFVEYQKISDEQQTPGALLGSEIEQDRQQSNPAFINDFTQLDTEVTRAGIQQTLSDHWRLLAEYTHRKSDGEFVLSFRGAPAPPLNPPNVQEREVTSISPRAIASYPMKNRDLLLTVGGDLESSEYFLQSVFGTQFNDQDIGALYLFGVVPVMEKVDLALGWRHAEVENDLVDRPLGFAGVPDDADLDDSVNVGSIGLTVHASENLRHFINYEENYRFAKVDEHTQSPVVPDFFGQSGEVLETQTGDSIELGVEWSKNGHSAKFVLYQLDIDDEILFDPTLFQNTNIDSARHQGAVLEGAAQLSSSVRMGFNYSYLDAEITSGSFTGNAVPLSAEHVTGINLNYQISQNWRFYAESNYTSERHLAGDFGNSLVELDGYTVSNIQFSYVVGLLSLELRVNNILDEEYSDSGSVYTLYDPATFVPTDVPAYYPSPERNFWISAELRFE